ncbi:MAG: 50S ribosomal protein L9 [Alphaproteobacteria bacterium CG_4_9_14_3_um_filter_47_13]|nr:MAG: 50S ribosomal protein L9 [Alphaproteobacteria bacterium CG_4_9_14_3_um_filter_47_13]
MPIQVILLEHVDHLGNLGDVVKVKPGYARNFLIPQSKALRATADNVAYFESRKKDIEKQNETKRKEAEKDAEKLADMTVTIIRHASEGGHLYGSVAARDIAEIAAQKSGLTIGRSMVTIHNAFKTIGLFNVTIALHPEVKLDIRVNIARSEEEAKVQLKTGRAMIAHLQDDAEEIRAKADAELEAMSGKAKKELLEEDALEAEQEMETEEKEKKSLKDAEDKAKAEKKAAKKAAAEAEAATKTEIIEEEETKEAENE